jgi:hypothetical protein
MKNIVYGLGSFCYVAKIFHNKLEITRHLKAGGLAPWGSIFSKNYKITANISAYDLLKKVAKGDQQ